MTPVFPFRSLTKTSKILLKANYHNKICIFQIKIKDSKERNEERCPLLEIENRVFAAFKHQSSIVSKKRTGL